MTVATLEPETIRSAPWTARRPGPAHGAAALYVRRLRVTTKKMSGIVGQLATPIMWTLVVGPALADSLGRFDRHVDYFTFIAVGQVAFLIPFTAMFNGMNVIVDYLGITRELLVAPVRRAVIPLASAAGVVTITLVQVALIVGLGRLRGAHFHTSVAGAAWFTAACVLLSLTLFGIGETLAQKTGRPESYGPLIPAVGVTPYFLSGALYPLSVLPVGLRQAAYVLPWTHAVAVMRYGLMEHTNARLADVWHLHSQAGMAALSLLVLTAFAAASLTLAARTFVRSTTS